MSGLMEAMDGEGASVGMVSMKFCSMKEPAARPNAGAAESLVLISLQPIHAILTQFCSGELDRTAHPPPAWDVYQGRRAGNDCFADAKREKPGLSIGEHWRNPTGRFWSASAGRVHDLTAGKPPLKLSGRIADVRGRQCPTHRSQRRLCQRETGLSSNLTFADAAQKVGDCESGHSQVAITDQGNSSAERLHPKAAHSHCRPHAEP